MESICKNCVYALKEGDNYFCRRYPPTVMMIPRNGALAGRAGMATFVPAGVSPPVNGDKGTCGEFRSTVQN